jgi:hypothetical protein
MVFAMTAMPAFADYTDYTAEKAQETTAITDLPVKETIAGKDENTELSKDAVLPDVQFDVTLEAFESEDDIKEYGGTKENIGVIPTGYDDTLTYTFNSKSTNFYETKTFDLESILAANKAVGEYWFTMTSSPAALDAAIGSNLTFLQNTDSTTYLVKINVTVDSTSGELIISQVRVYDEKNNKIYDDEGVTKDEKGEDVPRTDDVRNVEFVNPTTFSTLKITNHIDGNDISKNTDFTYYINIPIGGDNLDLQEGETITAVKHFINDKGQADTETITLTVGGDKEDILKITDDSNEFTLADGEYITLDVPTGMIFGIIQEDVDGVLTTHAYEETGDSTNKSTTEGFIYSPDDTKGCYTIPDDLDTEYDDANENLHKGTIASTTNTVDFYNYKGHKVETGISMDVIPYVMVVMAAAALAVLMISKKKTDR